MVQLISGTGWDWMVIPDIIDREHGDINKLMMHPNIYIANYFAHIVEQPTVHLFLDC